jgi:hypothetical protein
MKIHTLPYLKDPIIDRLKNGFQRGHSTGFPQWDEFYTVKRGSTTWWCGISSHGKTFMMLNVLKNLTEKYSWRHIIFSPEMGEPEELAIILFMLHEGRRPRAEDFDSSSNFLGKYSKNYFIMTLNEDELRVTNILEHCKKMIGQFPADTLTIDPWNELLHDFTITGGREDKYLENTLTLIRRFAEEHQVHFNIVIHPRTDRNSQRGRHPDPPTMFQQSGGEVWANKGMNVICVYRPAEYDGFIYPEHNKSQVFFQKIKPWYIGKKGTVDMFFQKETNRFFTNSFLQ